MDHGKQVARPPGDLMSGFSVCGAGPGIGEGQLWECSDRMVAGNLAALRFSSCYFVK